MGPERGQDILDPVAVVLVDKLRDDAGL